MRPCRCFFMKGKGEVMSVAEKDIVDGIALDEGRGIRMLITDHIDWTQEYNHLLILQEKINSYIMFCENGQYKDLYKDNVIEYVVIEIHFLYEPTENVYIFLNQIPEIINGLNLSIECSISEEEPDEDR